MKNFPWCIPKYDYIYDCQDNVVLHWLFFTFSSRYSNKNYCLLRKSPIFTMALHIPITPIRGTTGGKAYVASDRYIFTGEQDHGSIS
jgi:hypothetical protein